MVKKEMDLSREFYFSVIDNRTYIIYDSDIYKFSEIDILSLLKLCYKEGRSKSIGKKILEMYRNVYEENYEECELKLNKIGIYENGKRDPTKAKQTKNR